MRIKGNIRNAFMRYNRESFLEYMDGVILARVDMGDLPGLIQAYRIVQFVRKGFDK